MKKAHRMHPIEVIRATDIRILRGEVSLTERTIEDKNGHVTGRTRGDVINDWLRRYWKRREIDDLQYRAGQKLQVYIEQMDISPPSQLGAEHTGAGFSDLGIIARGGRAYEAKREWQRAIEVMGLMVWPAVIWVVVEGRPASDWAKAQHMHPREGITTLKLGLSALVTYWGLTPSGTRP
jgi:hypothetical protein